MARRQAVQLQAELQTDEEFDKFIEQPGLLVIDVYTEWCGPCIGMVNALKKVKLEQAGDALSLAIARADTISYLQRFHKKSEPTWLFITQQRSINIMFGAECPKLIGLILDEIKQLGKARQTYNINEMLPTEIERDNKKNAAKRAKLQKELDEQERKKSEYLNFVTETIRENLPDVGITIFGPHVSRESFRQLIEYGAEKFGIQCKDRRFQVITKEQFNIINYYCKNPLTPEILESVDGKEMFICFWKVQDELKEPVAERLQRYADDIVKSHRLPADEYHEEQVIPPLVKAAKVKTEFELPIEEECPVDVVEEPPKEQQKRQKSSADALMESPQETAATTQEAAANEEEGEDENDEDEAGEGAEPKTDMPAMPPNFDLDLDLDNADSQSEGEEEEESFDDTPKKNICTKTVTIPAIWVPKDWRTHAATIYVIFNTQTTGFLPPDPVPEPPHVIMAFDTYKRRDLVEFAERYKEDVPFYGFFTSEIADEAKFIASSKTTYAHQAQAATDKLIFKVNKRTSHTMLSLATYGPTYVSPNTTVGAEEAKIFFPENYVSAEQEMLENLEKEKTLEKSKGKKAGKEKKPEDTRSVVSLTTATAEPAALEAEGTTGEEAAIGEGEQTAVEAEEDVGEGPEMPPTHDELPQENVEEAPAAAPAPAPTEEPVAVEEVVEDAPEATQPE